MQMHVIILALLQATSSFWKSHTVGHYKSIQKSCSAKGSLKYSNGGFGIMIYERFEQFEKWYHVHQRNLAETLPSFFTPGHVGCAFAPCRGGQLFNESCEGSERCWKCGVSRIPYIILYNTFHKCTLGSRITSCCMHLFGENAHNSSAIFCAF